MAIEMYSETTSFNCMCVCIGVGVVVRMCVRVCGRPCGRVGGVRADVSACCRCMSLSSLCLGA